MKPYLSLSVPSALSPSDSLDTKSDTAPTPAALTKLLAIMPVPAIPNLAAVNLAVGIIAAAIVPK